MKDKILLIIGVGPGTGYSTAKKYSENGYHVAMISRDENRLSSFKKKLKNASFYKCDVSNLSLLKRTLRLILTEVGLPEVVIYNAVLGGRKFILDSDPALLEIMFRTNVTSLLVTVKEIIPKMVEKKKGTVIVTGNTAAWRGKSKHAMFASTKAAQRILTESIAREFGPKGIHVSYITIDAAIDQPRTRKLYYDGHDDSFFSKPSAIAETIFFISQQERSAWTFSLDLRPDIEIW